MTTFKNTSESRVKVRVGENDAGIAKWVTVYPGDTIELDHIVGMRYAEQHPGFIPHRGVPEEEVEEGSFAEELIEHVDGLGKKYASALVEKYPDKASLIIALEGGEEVPVPSKALSNLKQYMDVE